MVTQYHERLVTRFSLAVLLVSLSMQAMAAPGDTDLISTGSGNSRSQMNPAISQDGRYVAFETDDGIQLHDRITGVTERVDRGSDGQAPNSYAQDADLSPDGRFVSFCSDASNLVPGDTNRAMDVFVRDMQTGSTVRVSKGLHGENANSSSWYSRISAYGRFVAFVSEASNLVSGDTNGALDIFIWDRQTGVNELVSVGFDGQPPNSGSDETLDISDDGRYVAFGSNATNVVRGFGTRVNVFVRDRWRGITEPVSGTPDGRQPNGDSYRPNISVDGRFAVFASAATDVVPGAVLGVRSVQIVLRDRATGLNEWVSINSAGAPGNNRSFVSDVSADGRFVVFGSESSNLVPGDTNGREDAFLRDRLTGSVQRVSVSSTGAQAIGEPETLLSRISADGRFVVFATTKRLSPLDTDGELDVYVHEVAVPPPAAFEFTVKPSALAFGDRALFTGTTLNVWLRNKGTTALPITSVGLVGPNPGMFSVSNRCGSAVAVGTACSVRVTFRPTSAGVKSAKLKIVAGNKDVRTRDLAGAGVISP